MTHEAIEEVGDARAELRRLALELLDRCGQAVRDLHVPAAQLLHELEIVVARDGERSTRIHHRHRRAQYVRNAGTTIHEVAEEDDLAAVRMPPCGGVITKVAEGGEQLVELLAAAVHVADHVEGSVIAAAIVPHPFAHDGGAIDFLRRAQQVDTAEAFRLQVAERTSQLPGLLRYHVRSEGTIGARAVAFLAQLHGHVEYDGNREHVVLARERDERLPRLGLHVGGVDHGEEAAFESLRDDVVQQLERRTGGRLVVLVVGYESAAVVRGEHFEWPEVGAGEGALPAP